MKTNKSITVKGLYCPLTVEFNTDDEIETLLVWHNDNMFARCEMDSDSETYLYSFYDENGEYIPNSNKNSYDLYSYRQDTMRLAYGLMLRRRW